MYRGRLTDTPPRASETPPSQASFTVPPSEAVLVGCGSTAIRSGPAPGAADSLAANPWAKAVPESAAIVAYFWGAPPYLAAGSKRPNGSVNKILWVLGAPSTGDLVIEARPVGSASPVERFDLVGADSYPSTIDLPSAGCWHLDIAVGAVRAAIDVPVAPAPSLSP
jgi:hypothetical protein